MCKEKIFRIMILTVMVYSNILGGFFANHTTFAEDDGKKVLNYAKQPYDENYMSGRSEGASGAFFNQTNAELERKYQKLFGEETPEETQKRVEETGVSSQPVLGEYRPDDHIADTIAADQKAKEEELAPPTDLSDEEIANAIETCIKAGYDKEHCEKVGPKYAECVASEGDPLFCGMYLNVKTQLTRETNGTDGLFGVFGKYGEIASDPNKGILEKGLNLLSEGASDLVSWVKENPIEAALTVGMFFFPFGMVANLAVRGILIGANAISKGAKIAKVVKFMEGSGNIATRATSKASAWATETFGGARVTKLASGINNVSTNATRYYHKATDFIFGARKSAQYTARNQTSAERFKAMENYLDDKIAKGKPLSYQDRLLMEARKSVQKTENLAKSIDRLKDPDQVARRYGSHALQTIRKINPTAPRELGADLYMRKVAQVLPKISAKQESLLAQQTSLYQKADKIRDAAGEAFKISQESSIRATIPRLVGAGVAVGYDVHQFDKNSNYPRFSKNEAQEHYDQVKQMTENDRKALDSMQAKEEQKAQYYTQEMEKMQTEAFREGGAEKQNIQEIKWRNVNEAQQQANDLEARQKAILKDLQKNPEYQELQSKLADSNNSLKKIDNLQRMYDDGRLDYHPAEGDKSRAFYNANANGDALAEAQAKGLIVK